MIHPAMHALTAPSPSRPALPGFFPASARRAAGRGLPYSPRLPLLLACGLLLPGPAAHAAELTASDGAAGDYFGYSVGHSGNYALIGASRANTTKGQAYLFQSLSIYYVQKAVLTGSDSLAGDEFGASVSVLGNTAVIGAYRRVDRRGAAYLFRDLNTASGTLSSNRILTASDGATGDGFGFSSGLSGNAALLGAPFKQSTTGAVYLFRGLDTLPGSGNQQAKLIASDGAAEDFFGYSVSLSGNTGLVGASEKDFQKGAAYLFRNLNLANGTVTETARLAASDGATSHFFGFSLRLSGNSGLVGAPYANSSKGAAYLYRDLNTASGPGPITEAARLTASDGAGGDWFGRHTCLSGSTGLIAAASQLTELGSVYIFRNLNTAIGTVTESVKITSAAEPEGFANSLALDGDRFVIGSLRYSQPGKAYTGQVSAFTVVDEGASLRATGGLSFTSREDWVIGQSTDGNSLSLGAGDIGRVQEPGKAVHVGRAAGADRNALSISGSLLANAVHVGAAGNTGNKLFLALGGTVETDSGVTIAAGSDIGGDGVVEGDLTLAPGALWSSQATQSLTVTGKVSLPPSFGVASLFRLDENTATGTYSVIDGTDTDFAALGLTNWGPGNPHALSPTKIAWLVQQGTGLQVVVALGTPPPPLPALDISRSGGLLTLTWTTTLTGLIPETSTALTGPWQAVGTAPQQGGGNLWRLRVPLPVSDPRRFYRLRRP